MRVRRRLIGAPDRSVLVEGADALDKRDWVPCALVAFAKGSDSPNTRPPYRSVSARINRFATHTVNMASNFDIDEVIDPVESRKWIMTGLRSSPPPAPRRGKKRPSIDTW